MMPDVREKVNRVASLLDEVFAVLHELPQGHDGVVVDVEFVVCRPGFHGNEHDSRVELLPEDLRESTAL